MKHENHSLNLAMPLALVANRGAACRLTTNLLCCAAILTTAFTFTASALAAQAKASESTSVSTTGSTVAPSADPELEKRLNQAVEKAINSKRIVGTVIIVCRDGQIIYRRAAGFADRENAIPMTEDTQFRLASMSKTLTSAAALALVDKGILNLDDPVSKWLPDFSPKLADGTAPAIPVRTLLTHTAGLDYAFEEKPDGAYRRAQVSDGLDQPQLTMQENLDRIASCPLLFQPGSQWHYSLATDVLGAVIQKAAHKPLPAVIREYVTGPLQMNHTVFLVNKKAKLAVPYADGKPEPVRMAQLQVVPVGDGSFTFAPARAFEKRAYPSGGAGMTGTADDYIKLLEELRTNQKGILSRASNAGLTENQIGKHPATWDPGWGFSFCAAVLVDPEAKKTPHSKGTIQWGGAYGNHWFIDPVKHLSVVELTNTTVEGMSGPFSNEVVDAVYGTAH